MADKTAIIEFDEYPDQSFTLRLAPVPLDSFMDFEQHYRAMKTNADMRDLMEEFAGLALVAWTGVEGEPSAANLRSKVDLNVALALMGQWISAVAEAPLPLPRTSGAGEPSKVRRASKSRRS
jgi:hypothetical protein